MREWSARLGLIALGTGLGLTMAEGFVRWAYPHTRDFAIPGRVFVIDDIQGWRFRPRITTTHRTRHFSVDYRINASGYRDEDRTNAKPPDTQRVLLYGDSLMFGWGVPEHRRFSELLEQRVAGVEIWNRAVPGYGVDQELLAYQLDAPAVEFDEAWFFVSRGTLKRMHRRFIYAKYKPTFSMDGESDLRVTPPDSTRNRVLSVVYDTFSPFYLPYFLQEQIALIRQPDEGRGSSAAAGAEPRSFDRLALGALRRAVDLTGRAGQRMSVVVGDMFKDDREALRAFCREHGIAFLEIPREVATTATKDDRMDLVLGQFDRHWNTKATALVADALEPHVRELEASR